MDHCFKINPADLEPVEEHAEEFEALVDNHAPGESNQGLRNVVVSD
jgi:hypothetical protein